MLPLVSIGPADDNPPDSDWTRRGRRCYIGPGTTPGGAMEREAIWIGIGGQGVQLAANVTAKAAVGEGRQVSVISIYGGEMRGGPSTTTVIYADGRVQSPPLVSDAWSAVEMHPRYWPDVAAK